MKKYNEFITESEIAFSDVDISKVNIANKERLRNLSLKELGKEGKLAEYINSNEIKFGMLKAIYQDAINYKKKREYQKGLAKFAVRAIPLIIGPLFFPVWLISQILGATRAINKIIVPILNMEHKTYHSFLTALITKTMNLVEGDILPFLGKDWYYDVFYVHDGLVKMIRQEYIHEFALHIGDVIQKKDDNQKVPKLWLDNEFRKWLNEKFNLDLPIGKTMKSHIN
jgi:hypothetical protein